MSFPRIPLRLEEPEHAKIVADKERLAQALTNVIQNAVEAMPEGGNITIKSHVVERDSSKIARIIVADSGHGIPPENLARLSEPFFTTKLGGIGLGLSICRKIIQAHKGTLDITSKVDEGTVVEINLPVE